MCSLSRRSLLLIVALVIGVTAVAAAIVMAQTEPESGSATTAPPNDNDSNPVMGPQVIIPEAYRSTAGAGSTAGTSVYFTPQDENTSTTVLFLLQHGGHYGNS